MIPGPDDQNIDGRMLLPSSQPDLQGRRQQRHILDLIPAYTPGNPPSHDPHGRRPEDNPLRPQLVQPQAPTAITSTRACPRWRSSPRAAALTCLREPPRLQPRLRRSMPRRRRIPAEATQPQAGAPRAATPNHPASCVPAVLGPGDYVELPPTLHLAANRGIRVISPRAQ
jgi:hypothetical protein